MLDAGLGGVDADRQTRSPLGFPDATPCKLAAARHEDPWLSRNLPLRDGPDRIACNALDQGEVVVGPVDACIHGHLVVAVCVADVERQVVRINNSLL